MFENQPIMQALVEQGYTSKMKGVVIDEKNRTGVALIKLDNIEEPFEIYYHQDTGRWNENKPEVLVNPNVIDKIYDEVV